MAEKQQVWLDECYVEKVLRNADKDDSINVSSIEVKAATAKGDNYMSDMCRVIADFSRVQDGHLIQEKKSLIVKVVPQDDMREEVIEGMGLFVTELAMMTLTLPKMNKMLEDACCISLSARALHVQHEKPIHIVIEDLAPRGFRMANRKSGLDLDHCLIALRNLGKFHAASIALKEKDSEAITRYNKGILHKDNPPKITDFFTYGMKGLTDETVKWPELNPEITEKLVKLSNTVFEKGCEIAQYNEDDFNVLNHGDFWINNMLFRYDEKRKPIDLIFVDFQVSNYGSPAIDLHYFMGTSPTNEVRIQHRELLLREYHDSLASTMAELKCKTVVPGFDELQEVIRNRAFLEVIAATLTLPTVIVEDGDVLDFNKLAEQGEEYKNPCYAGKTYKKIICELLPLYNSMGLLDM